MSVVKVGDRVRATCGESVIVGEVNHLYPEGLSVYVDGDNNHRHYLHGGVWTVEVPSPPIPDVVGTIVRDRDGDAWQRRAFGWRQSGDGESLPLANVQRAFGPLTVLWTPEATP